MTFSSTVNSPAPKVTIKKPKGIEKIRASFEKKSKEQELKKAANTKNQVQNSEVKLLNQNPLMNQANIQKNNEMPKKMLESMQQLWRPSKGKHGGHQSTNRHTIRLIPAENDQDNEKARTLLRNETEGDTEHRKGNSLLIDNSADCSQSQRNIGERID